MSIKIFNNDCLEKMKELPDKSIDLFICDLPYGETNCKWDSVIDLEQFWIQFKRLRKSKRTACIHFCSTKFGYTIIKSNEKMFKMDMVWKKRNKTGGLQSRHRPMRNHEMVYFFYEQAPKYNRDKYHKRIAGVVPEKKKEKKDVVEEKDDKWIKEAGKNGHGWDKHKPEYGNSFQPPNPVSVVEEKFCKEYYDTNKTGMSKTDIYSKDQIKKYHKENGVGFEPPNPASVVEENAESNKVWGYDKPDTFKINKDGTNQNFDPKLPVSVVEEFIEPAEDEPKSLFESTKVFIGKRHHQTEKPQDILEFFLKYWTDEEDTVLDPTMGSGSTGVACKKLGRAFIGYELDEKIFEVAKKRLEL
jgi:DNA modification methylase